MGKSSTPGSFWLITLVMVLVGSALCCSSFLLADSQLRYELEHRTNEVNAQNLASVLSMEQNLNRSFAQADTILQLVKAQIETDGKLDRAQIELLKNFLISGIFNQISVSDSRGDLIYSAAPMRSLINNSDADHFQAHKKRDSGRLEIAAPRANRLTGATTIFLSRRLNDAAGNFAGIVSVGIAPGYFGNVFGHLRLDSDKMFVLLSEGGTLLVRIPDGSTAESGTNYKAHPVIAEVSQGIVSGVLEWRGEADGVVRVGAFRKLTDYPAVILTGVVKSSVFQEVMARGADYRRWATLFSALLSTLVLLLWWQMRKQVQAREALRVANLTLESKVEEKTQDLQAANEELIAQNEEMSAMNEELTALNEETFAMNETLDDTNRKLAAEVETRQKKELELSLREKQYRATTNLLLNGGEEFDEFLKTILHDAVKLVKAPIGYLGLIDEAGKLFKIRHAIGDGADLYTQPRPVEVGMVGEVVASGEILCVEDYRQYGRRIGKQELLKMTTVIMVPLKTGTQVKGALIANWLHEVHPITEADLEVLRQFAAMASISLERARFNMKITRQNQLLKGLAETTAALVNELDLDRVLQNVLEQAASFMEVPHGFIHIFEHAGCHSRIKCGLGRYAARIDEAVSMEMGGILAEILRTGEMVVVDDYPNWPNRMKSPFADEITAAMQAPLKIDGKMIGSIGISAFGEPLESDPEKIAVFEQFAVIASIAVKNAMAHQEAKYKAFHDLLTGLPNRAHLNRRLEEEVNKANSGGEGGAVLFIDLDDLKTINDSFGHSCGDGVIQAAARQIGAEIGTGGFLSRVGGDEFVVILPGETNLTRIANIAGQLVSASHREYEVAGHNIHMSASVGVTIYPDDGDKAEEVLKNADNAMYAAKAAGRNCWRFYEPEMLKDAYEKMVMTNDLRHALDRDELYLLYQPQVELGSGDVVGFEALLRWKSREHGLVPPARFIPLAEQSGLIHSIGEWVLREACVFARQLSEVGRESVRVAVNVSPRQLAAGDIVGIVRQCVVDGGIKPNQLEVEITESVLIDSLEESTQKLRELTSLGVSLSLDDFGTGFSSLTYLRTLPVSTLKIDKSFIDRILEDKTQEGFIRSIIDMAHVLELNVVAEGVESEAQLKKLVRFGCDCVQGYVFSKPVLPEEALRFQTRR